MDIMEGIKSVLGNYVIKNHLNRIHTKHEAVGFHEAEKIGILYDATDINTFEVMKEYVKYIRSQQKEILALGFVDKRKLQQNQFAQYGLDFFTRKQLRFGLIPNDKVVENFINEKFDILINIARNEIFPLRYISALSQARFRVGLFDEKNTICYDLMINSSAETGIKKLLNDIEIYLRHIKTKRNHEYKQA